MKKLITVLIAILITGTSFSQFRNTFRYPVDALGGLRVGSVSFPQIDSITTQGGKLRIMSGAVLQSLHGHTLNSDTAAMLTPYINRADTASMMSKYSRKASPVFTGTVNLPSDVRITALPESVEADTLLVWHNGRIYYTVNLIPLTEYPMYYVDATGGSDANDGLSAEYPWKTIAKVNATTFEPGSVIKFKRGEQWREQITISQSGTEAAPITYTAYGTGAKPIINGADVVTTWSDETGNVWSADCPVVYVNRGLDFSYMCIVDDTLYTQQTALVNVDAYGEYFIDETPTPHKIYVYSLVDPNTKTMEVSSRQFGVWNDSYYTPKQYINISYLDLRYCAHSGIYAIGRATETTPGYNNVDSCILYANRVSGIQWYNGYSNNTVEDCVSTYNGNGFYAASYGTYGSDDNIFRRSYAANTIRYASETGLFTDGHGFAVWDSDDCIVEYCTSVNNYYGIIIDANSKANDVTFRYNKVLGTATNTPGITVGGNIPSGTHDVYYNLIVNTATGDDGAGISVGGTSRSGTVNIFNNTIYQSASHTPVGIVVTKGSGVNLKNNIIQLATTGGAKLVEYGTAGTLPVSADYNGYYDDGTWGYLKYGATAYYIDHGGTGTIADWRTATNLDLYSTVTDPLFVNVASDWSLQVGSPCIDTGTVIATIPQTDILGNPMNGTPDKGCYEKQ